MERARAAVQYIAVSIFLLASIYAVAGLLYSPYSDQQIIASIVDAWEVETIGKVVLTIAVVVVAFASIAFAHRSQNRSVRRLGRVTHVLAIVAVGLLLYSHVALTERTTVLTGQTFGALYGCSSERLEEDVPLRSLVAKVEQVEASGLGRLGSDDLFLKLPGLEFLFCNDPDLRLIFAQADPDIEHFFQRWKRLGFRPAEWLKTERHGPGEKVRDA